MIKKTMQFFSALVLAATLPTVASAQELVDRKSPLADAPAIRHRVELRDKRFEAGVGLGSSIAAEFYHAVFVNLRLAFHINDWITISGTFGQNVTPSLKTGTAEQLVRTLPDSATEATNTNTVTKKNALGAMNRMGQILGLQAELSPITGKMALFSKLFMHYDVYALGGVGAVNFTADLDKCAMPKADESCPDTGMKIGANVGLGMHAFFNDWLALNLEIKDMLVKTNRAGQDTNGDTFADKNDLSLTHNLIFGANLAFFFPTVPKITD